MIYDEAVQLAFRALLALAIVAVHLSAVAAAPAGEYAASIAGFKDAHAAHPDAAEPVCELARAYRQLERWALAEVYIDRCQRYDVQPDWVAQLASEIEDAIAHAQLAPVTFDIAPQVKGTRIAVGGFPADEKFAPLAIHLPPGEATFTISAPGYATQQVNAKLAAGEPFTVRATLILSTDAKAQRSRRIAKWTVAGGGVVFAAGVGAWIWAKHTSSDLAAHDAANWDANIGAFRDERRYAYAGLSLGAAALAIGGALWLLRGDERPPTAQPTAVLVPITIGRDVGLAWSGAW